jgi:competence protein ComEC
MAFIAGGSLLFFFPQVPSGWPFFCAAVGVLCLLFLYLRPQVRWHQQIVICILLFSMGFAWNAHYAESRLVNILAEELEGKEFSIEGRVAALPQSSSASAKFAFEIDHLFSGNSEVSNFPKRVYLSWQPAWRSAQEIPEIIPGQRWKLKVKLKRPYGSLNPYTFDFERWSFHQDFGASGSRPSTK